MNTPKDEESNTQKDPSDFQVTPVSIWASKVNDYLDIKKSKLGAITGINESIFSRAFNGKNQPNSAFKALIKILIILKQVDEQTDLHIMDNLDKHLEQINIQYKDSKVNPKLKYDKSALIDEALKSILPSETLEKTKELKSLLEDD